MARPYVTPDTPLSERDARFVDEFLVDLDATAAYTRSGLPGKDKKQIAHKMLKKPNVRAAVDRAIAARAQRTEITADNALSRLWGIATADIADAFDDGGALLPPKKIPKHLRPAIASLRLVARAGQGAIAIDLRMTDKVGPLVKVLEHLTRKHGQAPPTVGSTTYLLDVSKLGTMTEEELDRGIANVDKMIAALGKAE